MTDNLKEMVSALLDGEANEIEVHKVLRKFGSDEKLKSSYMAWQQVRAAARKDLVLSRQDHLALHKRISEVIDTETQLEDPIENPGILFFTGNTLAAMGSHRMLKPVAGLAMAASIVVAILLGIQLQTDQSDLNEIEVATKDQAISPRYVSSNGLSGDLSESFDQDELVELDEEKQKMVREYLLQHERMTRLNPNVKVVTFDQPNKN